MVAPRIELGLKQWLAPFFGVLRGTFRRSGHANLSPCRWGASFDASVESGRSLAPFAGPIKQWLAAAGAAGLDSNDVGPRSSAQAPKINGRLGLGPQSMAGPGL